VTYPRASVATGASGLSVQQAVKQYLDDLDRGDRQPASVPEARVEHLKEKTVTIRSEMRKLRKIKKKLPQCGGQMSLTDSDARSMNSAGKGTGTVGYNVQTAVDTKNHMIVAHEVTNIGHDRGQLTTARSQTGGLARTAANGRAPLCDTQGVDGRDALPHQNATQSTHGDELARSGV
jgi:hypothetical protein